MSRFTLKPAALAAAGVVTATLVVGGVAGAAVLADSGTTDCPAVWSDGETSTTVDITCQIPRSKITETVTETATETVTETVTVTPTPTPTDPPTTDPPATAKKLIGMSAASNVWSQRLAEVGACGVEARRIFGDLVANGRSQETTIRQAISQGMMPVVSYKVPSVATLNSGGYDAWLAATKTFLDSLGVPVTATFWHEPHGDMTPAEFRAGSTKFLTLKSVNIKVGPILNGWLLDNRVADWTSYTSPALLAAWDFLGVDSYQVGDRANPSTWGDGPDRTVPLLETWLDQQGFGDKPILFGEYNAYTAAEVAQMGEPALSTPEVWAALVFNSDVGAKGEPLTGARLDAYKATKADARALHDPTC